MSLYNRTTQTNETVVRLYLIWAFFGTNALQGYIQTKPVGRIVLMCTEDSALAAVQSLLNGTLKNAHGRNTNVLLVFGAPNAGKSSFALNSLLLGLRFDWSAASDSPCSLDNRAAQLLLKNAIRSDIAVAAAQNRSTSARMSDYVIQNLGVSHQSRPVGTLSALAFSLISARNKLFGMPAPKLLNGAEQDVLLREVVCVHVNHVLQGDSGNCKVCALFNEYFASDYSKDSSSNDSSKDSWIYTISKLQNAQNSEDSLDSLDSLDSNYISNISVNSAFIHQLRDMLARLDEMGIVSDPAEKNMLNSLDSHLSVHSDFVSSIIVSRIRTQWNLAFALRSEYADCVRKKYPNAFRLDSSRLLASGVQILNDIFNNLHCDSANESSAACDSSLEFYALKLFLPRMLVVDDFHDVTLAGLAFLESLARLGVRIVLTANPDESVQSFRGSYPDYVVESAQNGVMQAAVSKICDYKVEGFGEDFAKQTSQDVKRQESQNIHDFLNQPNRSIALNLFSARVSLSIASLMPTQTPMTRRAWKMANIQGAFPIEKIESNSQKTENSSVSGDLYRTPSQEMDCVIWQIKRAHLDNKIPWKNMAIIAHDNATVRSFGERLRKDGVPVRYSSVTRALRDEPFIKALFAIIELAQFSQKSVDDLAKSVHSGNYTLYSIAHFVRSRVKTVLESPLVDSGDYNCADLAAVDSLMRSICSLSEVISGENASGVKANGVNASGENSPLHGLIEQWKVLSNRLLGANEPSAIESASVTVDNRVFSAQPNANSTQFSIESCYLLILKAFIDGCSSVAGDSGDLGASENEENQGAKSTEIFSVLQKMRPNSVHTRALMRVFNIVLRLSKDLKNNLEKVKNSGENQVSYVLGKAWNLCNCAKKWQIQALSNNDEGRAANDRLDAAMRLFEYANSFSYTVAQDQQMPNGGLAGPTIAEFIDQVRQMEIEADSLASVAPLPDAVTLTTPSGSVGRLWDYVWIPAVQQRVWPNTAARSTMFASETLVDIVLNSRILSSDSNDISDITYFFDAYSKNPNGICVSDKQAIFTGEQRSLLMAITRARKHLCISAVNSDDCVPSDFLYYYLPEIYWRNQDGSCDYTDFCGDFAAVDADARGLVCASRITLAKEECGSNDGHKMAKNSTIQDALDALNLLKNNGVDAANPDNWDFMRKNYDSAIGSAKPESQATEESQATAESQEESPLKSQEKSQEKISTNKNLVTLSPSMVDKLWSCPVCCLLESKFAGPTVGSTAAQFGTLIHETARWASQDEHLDNDYLRKNYPQLQAFVSGFVGARAQEFSDFDFSFESFSALQKKAIEDVANKMIEHYYSICPSDSSISNVKDRYRFIKNDLNVRRALYTIAQYFVGSLNGQNYPILAQKDEDGVVTKILPAPEKSKTAKPTIADVPLGSLEEAYCECKINATFGFDDILNAYNLAAKSQISLEDLYSIMGFLVGGWPNGGSCDLRVRIQGRIDRMELRKLNDNTQQIRLIDYKTGKVPKTQQVFNDLQLICYQLGIVFCSENNKDYEQLLKLKHTKIARSALFHVVYKDSPAQDNGVAENICQPSLFDEDGSLSASEIISRYRYSNNNRLYDLPNIDARNPAQGVSQSAWADFVGLPMRAKWSLMMISRVFFAAAAVKSTSFAVEPKADHKNYCRCLDVCPACAEKVDTVYEVIEGKNEQ